MKRFQWPLFIVCLGWMVIPLYAQIVLPQAPQPSAVPEKSFATPGSIPAASDIIPIPPKIPEGIWEPQPLVFIGAGPTSSMLAAMPVDGLEMLDDEQSVKSEPSKERDRARGERSDGNYERGTSALDRNQWDRAVEAFNRVIEAGGTRADGALYWKAYAQNKQGLQSEALSTLAQLSKSYPQSRWLKDAKALEVEIQSQTGRPVTPEKESDENLKLMAINGLLTSDPDRALPLLEKILQGNQSPRVKERALFVLSQSNSPKAREIIVQMAKGETNPDLQRKAIQDLSLFGGSESRKLLADIYASSSDVAVRKSIIQSFMLSGDKSTLFNLAKGEKDPELRKTAIRQLGVMGGQSELWQIYQVEPSVGVKREILQSMFIGGESSHLEDVARSEKDAQLRRAAIQSLGLMGSKHSAFLVTLYESEKDTSVRKKIIESLFIQGNAKALVDLAKKETDPEMKKKIVEQLSIMRSKDATDYLMELINK